MRITSELFEAFLKCPTKCFLRSIGETGPGNAYADWFRIQNDSYRGDGIKRLTTGAAPDECVVGLNGIENLKTTKWRLAVGVVASAKNLESRIHAVERIPSDGRGKPAQFVPIRFIFTNKLTRDDKLLLAFDSLVLSEMLGREIGLGKITHGDDQVTMKVNTSSLASEVRKLIGKITELVSGNSSPALRLNRHCAECEFQAQCRQKAIEKDDLSLLGGLSEREIKKQQSRGVTTVTQFAYTYRPGRRGKRKTGKARKHDHALQAVAIRDKKVYVLDSPTVPRSRAAIYLDVEGIPDRDFDYLIGLVAVVGECSTAYSFWADDRTQEKAIWDDCSRVINSFGDHTLYHYGTYELRFLERMHRLADEEGKAAIDRIRARSCNVLAAIYSHIYFPTRSNGLKDIGPFLGATWTEANASGIQSLAWRLAWESSGDESLKQHLLRYNLEDCLALRRVTEFVLAVCGGTVPADGPALSSAEGIQRETGFRFKKQTFFCPELDHINMCAYSDYQREKVFFRTSSAVRKSLRRKQRARKKRLKVNQEVKFPSPEVCQECGGVELQKVHSTHARKVVADLKFTPSGVKRWCIRYNSARFRCLQCKNTFLAAGYRALRSHLGSKLSSWAIYHHVALRQSGRDVVLSLNDIFGFSFHRKILSQIIMPQAAEQYRTTYERLKDKLRQGSLIHADETKGAVNDHSGYVWTFTNMEEVVYTFTPTREGTILEEMLDGFTGVLVSDFYAAYDSPKCLQQKCLIHLIRDVNNDVFHNPFDEELKQLAQKFVGVLKPIIETIDRFGLKRYHLNKHKKDVARYFRYLSSQTFGSEAAQKYQKRMRKYQDKLFVFLDYDGVPWNNNNAENAIKPFAYCRKIIQASFSESGLQDYLVFLSISQTCRNKNLNLLRFLLSGKLDLDAFADEPSR